MLTPNGSSMSDFNPFEERELTLRERVANQLERTGALWRIDVAQSVFSLIACGIYVIDTYSDEAAELNWKWYIEISLTAFFALDYCLALFLAPSKLRYLFSAFAIVDLLTILPVFIPIFLQGRREGTVNLGILRVVRVLRVLRAYATLRPVRRVRRGRLLF